MPKRYAITFWVTLFILIMAFPVYSALLDGKTFVGQSGKLGENASGEEELIFRDGMLYSVGCAKYGFGESEYTTDVEGDRVHFRSTLQSETNGQITWDGTVVGNKLDANFIWTKKRWYWKDAHQEKWMKGSLKE